jgi:hypothetical protein
MPNARSRWTFLPIVMWLCFMHTVRSNAQDKLSFISFKLLEVVERAEEIRCRFLWRGSWSSLEVTASRFVYAWRHKTAVFVNKVYLMSSVVTDKLGNIHIFSR